MKKFIAGIVIGALLLAAVFVFTDKGASFLGNMRSQYGDLTAEDILDEASGIKDKVTGFGKKVVSHIKPSAEDKD